MELNRNPPAEAPMADPPAAENISDIVDALKRLPAAEIDRVRNTVLKLGEESSEKKDSCPACGGNDIVRNGHKHGKQAYLCRGCGKSFVSTTSTVMFMSHQPASSWMAVLSDTLDGVSLAKTARELGISTKTVFFMRHKILLAAKSVMDAPAVPDKQAKTPGTAAGNLQAVDTADPSAEEAAEALQNQEPAQTDKDACKADKTCAPDSSQGVQNPSEPVDQPVRKQGGPARKSRVTKVQVCKAFENFERNLTRDVTRKTNEEAAVRLLQKAVPIDTILYSLQLTRERLLELARENDIQPVF